MIAAVLLLTALGQTEVSAQTLVLHHANGTTTDVELFTRPSVTFQNDKVYITSSVLSMEYPKDNVLLFTYKGKTSGIGNLRNEQVDYTQESGRLVFHGVKATDHIAVYTSNGVRVPVSVTRGTDNATLSLSSVPSGVYVLNVNGKTSKFTKP